MRSTRLAADWPLAAVAAALTAFGVAMVYSAGQTDVPTLVVGLWRTQLLWVVVGVLCGVGVTRLSVRILDAVTVPTYALTVLLLGALLVIGQGAGTAASTKSWLAIGGVRLGQPSELAKIAVILMLARVLSANRAIPSSLRDLVPSAVVVGVPWLLIMAQPDLGTGIVFVGIYFAMLFWAGVSWPLLLMAASPALSLVFAFSTGIWGGWFLLLLAMIAWVRPTRWEGVGLVAANLAMGVLAPLLWGRLDPYQQRRILVFLDPSADPRASGYHVIQSQVAIGSGGIFGKGFTLGSQKRLAFLPEQQTDFIFPVVAEELGFLGVLVALALFTFLLHRTVRVAARATSPFASLVAFGLTAAWFTHIVVNIGMTVGLLPVTGIPLPFFSYGGSFMLMSWLSVGLLILISAEGRGRAGGIVT
jgi:rod shape determining protein RodA